MISKKWIYLKKVSHADDLFVAVLVLDLVEVEQDVGLLRSRSGRLIGQALNELVLL